MEASAQTNHSAEIIQGKLVAQKLREDVAADVAKMDIQPGLAVILVGEDPASAVYVRNKVKACEKAGIKSFESHLPAKATQAEVEAEIEAFNSNKHVHGILLQLPTPDHLDSDALIQHIDPAKDVDGLSFINQGKLISGDKTGLVPCTPQGSLMLIKSVFSPPTPPASGGEEGAPAASGGDLSGLNAVVIGRSLLFGKPMAQLLLAENCTVTMAHSRTKNLDEICRNADILVAAVGRPKMVKGDWIKPGAVVIDVGINRISPPTAPASGGEGGQRPSGGTLCGDVDYDEAVHVASAITPVPGGVGPMTIACLLKNTVQAAKSA